jgi:hypothetical protein
VSDIDTGVVDSLKALDPDGRLEKRTSIRDLAMSLRAGSRRRSSLMVSNASLGALGEMECRGASG